MGIEARVPSGIRLKSCISTRVCTKGADRVLWELKILAL